MSLAGFGSSFGACGGPYGLRALGSMGFTVQGFKGLGFRVEGSAIGFWGLGLRESVGSRE